MHRTTRSVVGGLLLLTAAMVHAAERVPVAVLWVGSTSDDARGLQLIEGINQSLGKSATARPIDTANLLNLQLAKMPSAELEQQLRRAREHFGALQFAEAALAFEAAERVALEALPIAVLQKKFADIERGLLASYDQLGRRDDAARAAERLSWVATAEEPARALLEKHWQPRHYDVAYPPIEIQTEPAGAEVYRNLKLVGTTSAKVAGGDGATDRIGVELPGFRPVRQLLGWSDRTLKITLVLEDRLAVRLDQLRSAHLDASPALVAALAKELGAERVLLVSLDKDAVSSKDVLKARFVDVAKVEAGVVVSLSMADLDKVAQLGAPTVTTSAAAVTKQTPVEAPKKSKWGKWYTWVAAGGVVLLVGGLLIAQNVGDDKFTVSVKK